MSYFNFCGDAGQLVKGQINISRLPLSNLPQNSIICTGSTSSSDPFQNISNSNSTYVLTSNGNSALPSFKPLPSSGGGVWSLLASKIAIGTSTSLTINNNSVGWSSSTYSLFKIVLHNVIGNNQGTGSVIQCQILTPSTAITSTYLSGLNYNEYNTSTTTNVNSTSYILIGAGGNHTSGILYIDMNTLMCYGQSTSSDGSGNPYFNTIQSIISTATPTYIGFEFSFSNGASFYEESPNTSISIYGLSQG